MKYKEVGGKIVVNIRSLGALPEASPLFEIDRRNQMDELIVSVERQHDKLERKLDGCDLGLEKLDFLIVLDELL